jgi:pimeloyl-ACP methyl ester carboxylesterase
LAVKYDLFKPDTIRLSWELQTLGEGVDIQSEVQRIKRGENGAGEKTLLLLIHGLGGKAEATWGRFPTLLVENDPDFARDYRVAFFSYPTMLVRTIFSRKAPSIHELADALRTEIENRYADYTSIVLVCHSLGGLIGRMYLLNEVKAQRPRRVSGIVLFAVPNNGAELAGVGKYISWQHRQMQQLCRNSDVIEQLNRDWFTMGLGGAVRAKYVTGTQDRVVDRFSARATWGNPDVETVVGKGHIDIVKPERVDDGVVIVLKRFLKDIAAAQPVRTHIIPKDNLDRNPAPLAPVAKEIPELRPNLVSHEPGIEYLREEPNGVEPTTGYTKPGRNMALVATICNEPTNSRVGFAHTVRAQITYYDLLGNIYQRINIGVWINSPHFESIDLGPNDIGQLVLAVERKDKGRKEFVLPCAEGTDPRNQADIITVYPLELEGCAKPIRLAAEVTLRESQGYKTTHLYTISINGEDSFVESRQQL